MTNEAWRSWGGHPLMNILLAGADVELECSTLDYTMQIDDNLHYLQSTGQLDEALLLVETWLDICPDEASATASLSYLNNGGRPDGPSGRQFLLRLHDRIKEVLRDPAVLPPPALTESTGFELPREGRWTHPALVKDVVTAALLPHEAAITTWLATPAECTWQRQHFFSDLSTALGVIGEVAPVSHPQYGRPTTRWERSIDAVSVTVTIRRTLVPNQPAGQVEVYSARPEIALDTSVRDQFPDLCHFYGGYFGQIFSENFGYPSEAMYSAMFYTGQDARVRLQEQLSQILHYSDNDIHYIVENCGSYALPECMRHWIDRTLWRLDRYDWAEPQLAPPSDWPRPPERWASRR